MRFPAGVDERPLTVLIVFIPYVSLHLQRDTSRYPEALSRTGQQYGSGYCSHFGVTPECLDLQAAGAGLKRRLSSVLLYSQSPSRTCLADESGRAVEKAG